MTKAYTFDSEVETNVLDFSTNTEMSEDNKVRNSILKYLHLDYVTENILNQKVCFIRQGFVGYA